jgi:hypothetical protein
MMNVRKQAGLVLLVATVALSTVGCSSMVKQMTSGGGSGGGGEAAEAANVPDPEPNPELVDKMLSCIPDLKPQDVQYGKVAKYKFTQGMKTDERTGFLERESVEMTNGCYVGALEPEQCVSMTVDTAKFEGLGNSNKWEVQCVYADDPSAGMIKNKNMYPYALDRMKPNYYVLMCGHDQGEGYECAEGSNSKRGGIWRDKLKAAGKTQLGFCVNRKLYQETDYEDKDFPKGRYLYCQYFNSTSGKALFGWQQRLETSNL